MTHSLQISVTKEPKNGGIASVRSVSIREKLLRFMLGNRTKLTVIVPGDSVQELAIKELGDDVIERNIDQGNSRT